MNPLAFKRTAAAISLAMLAALASPAHAQDRTYYGWKGEVVRLKVVPDKVGVIFDRPQEDRVIANRLRQDGRVRPVRAERIESREVRGNSFLIRTRGEQSQANLRAIGRQFQNTPGFVSANLAYSVEHLEDLRNPTPPEEQNAMKESLLTNQISVLISTDIDRQAFEQYLLSEPVSVASVRDYSSIGAYRYRLELIPDRADPNGDDAISVANRLFDSPMTLEASPVFTPLYGVSDAVPFPNDPGFADDDPNTTELERWYFRQSSPQNNAYGTNTKAAWDLVYGSHMSQWPSAGFPPYESSVESPLPRIVIASLDSGVSLDYSGDSTVDPAQTPGAPRYVAADPLYTFDLSGIQDLSGQRWVNVDELGTGIGDDDDNGFADDVFGWDFVGTDYTTTEGDNLPWPDSYGIPALDLLPWHGTFASTVAAAVANNGESPRDTSNTVGMCPSCVIMPVRYHVQSFNSDNTEGTAFEVTDVFYAGRAEDAILYAVDNGAHVIAIAMAISTYDAGIYAAVRHARERGVVIVVGAANSSLSLDAFPHFPQAFPEVITVGACGSNGIRSEFAEGYVRGANYGWTVDIVAPSPHHDDPPGGIRGAAPNGGAGGTSSAMPQVAGIIGLMLTVNPKLSPAEIQFILQDTAVDLVYERTEQNELGQDVVVEEAGEGPDRYTGYGIVNAGAAVESAMEKRFSVTIEDEFRPTESRDLLSLDRNGNLIIDGLYDMNQVGQMPVADGMFGISSGGVSVMNLGSGAGYNPSTGQWQWPTLYLADLLETSPQLNPGDIPLYSRAFSHLESGQTVLDGFLSNVGKFVVRGDIVSLGFFDNSNLQGSIVIHEVNPCVDSGPCNAIQDAVNIAEDGHVVQVNRGTYAPFSFRGKNIVVRSSNPFEREIVNGTIIDAGDQSVRCVSFVGKETSDAALIGFTIQGTHGGGIEGSAGDDDLNLSPGSVHTKARILYNRFVNNLTVNSVSPLPTVMHVDGLIQGNRFGDELAPNGRDGSQDLLICDSDGVIRKNFIVHNFAGPFDRCDGKIAQNLIASNRTVQPLVQKCNADFIANIFYRNSSWNGVFHTVDLNYVETGTVEQNTFYGNTSNNSGAVFRDFDGEIKNNILWENRRAGVVDQIDSLTSVPSFCAIQEGSGIGTDTVIEDPRFISTRLVTETDFATDFQSNSLLGWTLETNTWYLEVLQGSAEKYVTTTPLAGSSDDILSRTQTKADREFRFTYARVSSSGTEGAVIGLRVDTSDFPYKYLELVIQEDAMFIRQREGATPLGADVELLEQNNASVASAAGVWYDVLVCLETWADAEETIPLPNPVLLVSRAERGEPYVRLIPDPPGGAKQGDASYVFDIQAEKSSRFALTTQGSSVWRFDDVAFDKRNLDVFLNHSEGSPCIDPISSSSSEVTSTDPYRDFDDTAAPLLGTNAPGLVARRDLGAHEYPDLGKGVYWWNRFLHE